MSSKLLTIDEVVELLLTKIKEESHKYQEETGCTDAERDKFEVEVATGALGGEFDRPMRMG